jgi:hypothetical protein
VILQRNPCGCYLDDTETWHRCQAHQNWQDQIMADLDAKFGKEAMDRFIKSRPK